jgi:hypothetical protein
MQCSFRCNIRSFLPQMNNKKNCTFIINRFEYTSVHWEQAPSIHYNYTVPQTNIFTTPYPIIRRAISQSDTFIYLFIYLWII